MSFKSFASPIAIAAAAALTFGGAAFAQTMVGDQSVTDENLAAVQTHCDQLSVANSDTTEEAEQTESFSTESDATVDNEVGALDYSAITLEDCRAAGLVQ